MEFHQLIKESIADIQALYTLDQIPWVVGCSWGKDSTATLQLIWNAIAQLPPEKRHKTVYVTTTDTRIEDPIVFKYVQEQISIFKKGIKKYQMPFEAHILRPPIQESYWVRLLGWGYSAPTQKYRWCTPRLKINTNNKFIQNAISKHSEAIVVIGVRKAESISRKANIEKHQLNEIRKNLTPSQDLLNASIYTPIADWQTTDVWMYLLQVSNPWGANNQDLFALYKGATEENECPMVVSKDTPSCGSSRFGCWTCTLTSINGSLKAQIDNDENNEWLQPLLDYRNLLKEDNRFKRDYRWTSKIRLYELKVNKFRNIEPIRGRYTKEWRTILLRKLLETQLEVQSLAPDKFKHIELISIEELIEIRRLWIEYWHDHDDLLSQIYQEIIGHPFPDNLHRYSRHIKPDTHQVLAEICDGEQARLLSNLLGIEQEYKLKNTRKGIYQSLEKQIARFGVSDAAKVVNAYKSWQLDEAIALDNQPLIQHLLNDQKPIKY